MLLSLWHPAALCFTPSVCLSVCPSIH